MTEHGPAVRALLGRGSIYTIGIAVQLSAGLLTLPVVTRLLDPDEFGVAAAAAVVRQVLAMVVAIGIPGAITRFAFDAGDGHRRAQALITSVIAVAIVGTGIAEISSGLWVAVFSDLDYGAPLRIAVWSAVPFVGVLSLQAMLRADDRAGWFVALTIVSSVMGQLLGIGALVFVDRTATWYLAGVAAGFLLAAAAGLFLYPLRLRGLTDRVLLKAALVYGGPTVLHGLAFYVLTAGDRVVIERLDGLEAVGRYHVAYLLGGLGIAVVGSFNNAWAPLIYGAEDERRWTVLSDTSVAAFRIAVALAGGIALLAPLGLAVAAPAEYQRDDLVAIVAIVAAAVIPLTWYLANVHVIFHVGGTGSLALITPTTATVNIVLNFVLIPRFGLAGAAYATVIGYAIQAGLTQLASRRQARVPWRRRALLGLAAAGVAIAAGGAALPAGGVWSAVRFAAAATLGLWVIRASLAAARIRSG